LILQDEGTKDDREEKTKDFKAGGIDIPPICSMWQWRILSSCSKKIKEDELVLADRLKNILRTTREAFNHNFDPKDPEFVNLFEALKQIFEK